MAVLRSLRSLDALWKRWTDEHARLHGRVLGRSGMTNSNVESEGAGMSSQPAHARGGNEPRHIARMFVAWLILSVVGDVLFYTLLAPHMPPGTMTSSAKDNQFDFNVLFVIALPVVFGVWIYMGSAVPIWRAGRKATPEPVG